MSQVDENTSLDDTTSNESSSESGDSEEMEIIGIVEPYADEPLAHTSDEDEDDEDDQDGLTPAVLRSRFEGEVSVDDWLVIFYVGFMRFEGETYGSPSFLSCVFVDTFLLVGVLVGNAQKKL